MWYVIQTMTGKEQLVRDLIRQTVPEPLYDGLRILYYETRRRYQGSWHTERKRMFPGYLFVITETPEELIASLHRFPAMSRLLGTDGIPVPLSPEEERFLRTLTGEEELVPFSIGVQEGDAIRVTRGCLQGLESRIRKVDRHKRKAWIEVEMLGQVRLAEVGLEIVEKKE